MTSIFDEYRKFAGTKVLADQEVMHQLYVKQNMQNNPHKKKNSQFIETFDHDLVPYDHQHRPSWL